MAKLVVMVIDDEPAVLKVTEMLIESLDTYQVEAFPDGASALAAFKASPGRYDIIITDLMMPEMSGQEISANAKAIRPDIPVIAVTGFGADTSLDVFEATLGKPFTRDSLAACLKQFTPGD
ncbi:MAG: response regulator [Pseudomonadota bacterium]